MTVGPKMGKNCQKNRCLQRGNAGLGKDPKKLPSMKEKGFCERDKNFQIEGLC